MTACLTGSQVRPIKSRVARRRAASLSVVGLCLIAGCRPQLDLVPLKGQVKYQDKPLEYGSVMFQPVGGGPLARGQIQSDGSFRLTTLDQGDGVRRGLNRVRITAFDAQKPSAKANADRELMLGESAIPRKYQSFATSGIEIEVTPDMPQPVMIELD